MFRRSGRALFTRHGGGAAVGGHLVRRGMVGKAANRAAVHGSKLPVPDVIPKDEMKMEIRSAIEEKQRKRREIESCVDSKLNNWKVLYVEEFTGCSK